MADSNAAGFTLVEVVLFLALTALFMLIAFTGIVGRSRNVQFTDSIRSLEGFLQRQISDVRNGVNLTGEGDQLNQIVLGSVLKFNPDSDIVNIYKIRGARLPSTTGSARSLIYDSVDDLSGGNIVYEQGQYQIEWSTLFRDPATNGSTGLYLGFLRNPSGAEILPYVIDDPSNTDPLTLLNNSQTYQPGSSGAVGNFCFEGASGQVANIKVGEGNRQLDIEPLFNPGSGACSGI